ncbi:tRNA dihydrouridine synthase DusB [Actinomyces sp. B33]|uniref:tRNA dihydrouridine synthase DusB n=1 Tax=Actinomyces sp. B33 TaxID=2942131 RepID=UPI0023405D7E|nr:tRNA dihydrouridine synthase DusB [Actinomyces sp. B33]MDC4232740.1 tRNA dihydrouridine synthase DusB [Actinomyces sp. B33]
MSEPPGAPAGPTPVVEVGPLRLWSPVVLAPMAGVTDAPFRRLCREFGEQGLPAELSPDSPDRRIEPIRGVDALAGLYVMEMVTSRALVEGNRRTLDMVRPDPQERVRSVQLYGVDPDTMAKATEILVDCDLADHIDLNFGCPVPKVTRKGGGAALPWKKDLFDDLVRAVIDASERAGRRRGADVPVTVKMRIGIDDEHVTYLDAARTAVNRGVAAVALHARTQTQHYSGAARWEAIARLKEAVPVPVLGNGDVFSGEDAQRMMGETGCDAVVVGRGCQGRPWLFADIVSTLMDGPAFQDPGLRGIASIIETHARWAVDDQGDESRAMREMRKHIGWYLRGFSVGGATRHALGMVSTLDELHELLTGLDLDQGFPTAARGPRGRAGGEKTPHLPDGWLDSPFLSEAERADLHLAEDGANGG